MSTTDETDVALTRLARSLPQDVAPERDLWQGIERRIISPDRRRMNWQNWAIAASLVLSCSAVFLTIMTGQDQPAPLAVIDRPSSVLPQRIEALMAHDLQLLASTREDLRARIASEPDNPELILLLVDIEAQEQALLQGAMIQTSENVR
ncbi:MAG: hypothetical protein AAF525_02585 [Pseudomonadota bacterium]